MLYMPSLFQLQGLGRMKTFLGYRRQKPQYVRPGPTPKRRNALALGRRIRPARRQARQTHPNQSELRSGRQPFNLALIAVSTAITKFFLRTTVHVNIMMPQSTASTMDSEILISNDDDDDESMCTSTHCSGLLSTH